MRASDISRGRQILARFLNLAEERLAYLTDLYETGRWTRYFTQDQLLDNVRDAKTAVDAWTLLLSTEALPNNRPVDLDWLNQGRPLPPRRHLLPEPPHQQLSARFTTPLPEPVVDDVAPHPVPVMAEPIRVASPAMPAMQIAAAPNAAKPLPAAPLAIVPRPVPAPPKTETWQNALDFALMRERYPLLRKTG